MNLKRKHRMWAVVALLLGVSVAVGLALYALQQNINLFYSPSQIADHQAPDDTRIRAGGMVVEHSLQRSGDSLMVHFALTDFQKTIEVEYTGILPDLFREGQGVVALGKMNSKGVFVADQVLAKHDEKYMPPEVAAALKASGKLPPQPSAEH
ncbi:cytochrome C biogenesis protein CcmE [Pokkaliibacter plantistimulans]|uniref:Cytochrome c-type biogenesis protein CcmE n=2 Tax=Pseudomonadota TaxID=1224 RepID=A0ABX5LV18_9GAMM|nr:MULTISPECIES: cytochrome c maturation protein CcmE [Pokkaliibacter]MDH2431233.1 cytochrome c maturation protein CcmE [Pokkaliibacter sp. MBI-7]PPC78382.1 cytochrome c maturation protein CcmE [Pokkaliibacter plantistimulans]PXF29318.1 cytochrome C biogenesis protein CcmE [Pokkaliibacter plantistimulans]